MPASAAGANPFKGLRKAALEGRLQASDIEPLLAESSSVDDRISRLRFTLRLRRWVNQKQWTWPLDLNLEQQIAGIYRAQQKAAQNPALALRYALWARRYGDEDFDWGKQETAFRAHVNSASDFSTKLTMFRDADVGVECDTATGAVRARFSGGDIVLEAKPAVSIRSQLLWPRMASALAGLEFGAWSLALATDKGPKSGNEDAALFTAFSDDSFLAAVADGTGDSHDGARAAEVLLTSLSETLAATGQMRIAVELAAAAVRADNLARHEENACTLVALHVRKNGATLVHLSDPFHWTETDGAPPFWSHLNKANRANIGGEPLGYTITSSGNRVDCFQEFAGVPDGALRELTRLRSFVLGCDGLLPVPDEEAVGERCVVPVQFDRAKPHPLAVVVHCCDSARQAMQSNRRSGDNITCVAGYRWR